MPEQRIELRLGDVKLRILKVTRSRAGDVYLMPRTPTGLHLSHHASGKRHVRDDLGYHRDFVEPTSEADLEAIANLLLYRPQPEASLVVMRPVGEVPVAPPPEGNVASIPLELMAKALESYQLLRVAGRQFDLLLRGTQGQRLIIVDETAKRLVFVNWQGDVPIPMSFPLDFDQFRKGVAGTAFGQGMLEPILGGLDRAYQKVEADPQAHPFAEVDFDALNAQLEGSLSAFMEAWNAAPVVDLSTSNLLGPPVRDHERGPVDG